MTEQRPPAPEPRRASRGLVVAFAVVLGCVWLLPGAVGNENRAPTEFPDLSAAGLASAGDLRVVDAALVDRLPAKGGVIGVLAPALIGAGISADTQVLLGDGGEPFLTEDLTQSCALRVQVEAVERRVLRLQSDYAARGIDLVFAIPPDKTSIERESLGPFADQLMRCSDANRAVLQAAADRADSPLLVAWKPFEQQTDRLYRFGDSHWNPAGAAVFAGMVVDRAHGSALFDADDLVAQPTEQFPGDLFALMGVTRTDPMATFTTVRDGVTTTRTSDRRGDFTTDRFVSTGPGLIGGRTLILGDSFVLTDTPILAPYFADVTIMRLAAVERPSDLALLDGYDRVIVQQVQRSVPLHLDSLLAAEWITAGR